MNGMPANTTTTMVATLLDAGGLDPTVINGGVIHAYGSNARAGALGLVSREALTIPDIAHLVQRVSADGHAREQEMRALVEERRAAVVEAEAEVPRAISEACRNGHLGIMDYYRMRNVQADTRMRDGFAGQDRGTTSAGEDLT